MTKEQADKLLLYIAEREAKVEEIKKRYPYIDNNENKEYSDSVLTL